MIKKKRYEIFSCTAFLALVPATIVFILVAKCHQAGAVAFVELPFAFVVVTICIYIDTFSLFLPINPIPFICIPISVEKYTSSILLIVLSFTLVLLIILIGISSLAIFFALFPASVVLVTIKKVEAPTTLS